MVETGLLLSSFPLIQSFISDEVFLAYFIKFHQWHAKQGSCNAYITIVEERLKYFLRNLF